MNTESVDRLQRRKQRTRKQLQQAVIGLILEEGYDAVTVQGITDRADLGRGTFYLYFNNKEDAVWQSLRETFDQIDRDLNVRYPQRTLLTEYIGYQIVFEQADKNRSLYRIILGSQGSAALTNRIQDYFSVETEREIRQHGMFAEFDLPPAIVAQYVTGVLVRLVVWWIETPNEYTSTQMATMIYQLLHRNMPTDDS